MAITMKDIIESNRVKDEAWNDYKESLIETEKVIVHWLFFLSTKIAKDDKN